MLFSILFCLTLLASSSLLFILQPMCAKMLLPGLGGTPSVWNTCMVFFQSGLLAGYAYAHWGSRWLGTARHALVHLAALCIGLFFLPIALGADSAAADHPILYVLTSLTVTAGVPFCLVSATAPLLQDWFSRTGRDPYFLYAASNLGSFLALASYPFLIEPHLTLTEQTALWTWGYWLLVGLSLICFAVGVTARRPLRESSGDNVDEPRRRVAIPGGLRLRWLALALVPSSLMLSVTSVLTTDIAAIPLLWVVPLAIYLLTFVLVFARKHLVPRWLAVRGLPLVVLVLSLVYLCDATVPIGLILGIYLAGFFWVALACHGELARIRPGPEHLTEFYLVVALGGVLGGVFNALIAPLLFNSLVEYPLMLVAACLLRPSPAALGGAQAPPLNQSDWLWPVGVGAGTLVAIFTIPHLVSLLRLSFGSLSTGAVFAVPLVVLYFLHERPLRHGLTLAAILSASVLFPGVHGKTTYRIRGFFGAHRVTEERGRRFLVHGNTIHGIQRLDAPLEPQGYYEAKGPFGRLMNDLRSDARLQRVGVVGLGTGGMAAYADQGRHWTFFEIDPAVIHIARDSGLFTFLADARTRGAVIDVLPGDGRASLRQSRDKFGLLIVDVFGSDAIPMHFLTREAMKLYFDRLEEHGLLIFHVSNRYLDLVPVFANLARDHDPRLACFYGENPRKIDASPEDTWSSWVAVCRSKSDFPRNVLPWGPAEPRPAIGVWTDDFSNLFQVFRWKEE